MRSATQVLMIARSGNMQIAPIAPGKVIRGRFSGRWGATRSAVASRALVGTVIMEGSDTAWKRDIVTYAHPRTQGADRPVAGTAGGVSVLQRGRRHHLCRQGSRAPRSRAELSGRVRHGSQDR